MYSLCANSHLQRETKVSNYPKFHLRDLTVLVASDLGVWVLVTVQMSLLLFYLHLRCVSPLLPVTEPPPFPSSPIRSLVPCSFLFNSFPTLPPWFLQVSRLCTHIWEDLQHLFRSFRLPHSLWSSLVYLQISRFCFSLQLSRLPQWNCTLFSLSTSWRTFGLLPFLVIVARAAVSMAEHITGIARPVL